MIRIFGIIILCIGLIMIIPMIYSGVTHDAASYIGFKRTITGTILLGMVICFTIPNQNVHLKTREGYIVVAASWVIAIFISSLPFYFAGVTETYIDAFFEATSGLTTTGCTALANVLPNGLMLWKAMLNWLGGMGILILIISILPALGINGQLIARAEAPGPVMEKVTVRMSDSAKILYLTYFSFTLAEFLLLLASPKMNAFDAVITTLGSISTGGILVHPEGIAFYDSVYIEIVISVFCILASVNFILYHYLLTKKPGYLFRDIELRAFIIILAGTTLISTFGIMSAYDAPIGEALRDSFFQVVSMSTTTGYARSAYTVWPAVCQILLITVMFIGGCGASTSGSIKVIRVLVMFKVILRGGIKRLHPRSVVAVKIGGIPFPAPVVSAITVFILTYMFVFLFSTVILSLQGLDLSSTATAALAMLSNTGIGFGETTSVGDFSCFNPALKLYLCALMVVGRLEMFPIIILFTKNFWGKDR